MFLSSNLFNLCDIEGLVFFENFMQILFGASTHVTVYPLMPYFPFPTTYPSHFMFFSLSSVFFLNPGGPVYAALYEHDNITRGFSKSLSILHHSSDRSRFLEFLPELFLDVGCLDLVKVLSFKLQSCALKCIKVL